MKSLKITTVTVTLLPTFIVNSCGTAIPMTEAIPAKVNMARGSKIAISCKGAVPYYVGSELLSLMRKDQYYTFVPGNADYTIVLTEYYDGILSYPYHSRVNYSVIEGDHGDILYSDTTPEETKDADKRLAKDIYETFAPHEKEYKIRVGVDSKNQLLKQAVESARKKNYVQTRTLALASLQQFPQDPETYFLLAMIERTDSNFEKSNAYLRKALELKPGKEKYKQALQKNLDIQRNEANVINQLSN